MLDFSSVNTEGEAAGGIAKVHSPKLIVTFPRHLMNELNRFMRFVYLVFGDDAKDPGRLFTGWKQQFIQAAVMSAVALTVVWRAQL